MTTTAWLLGRGVELLESPDALLGRSERGGHVRLGQYDGEVVAVKFVEGTGQSILSALDKLPPPPEHPHLVRVLHRLSGTGRWVEVRSLCEGGELYDRIAEEGVLEPQEAFSLFEQVVRAVEHSHACGVAHGQLRPEHVLLSRDETIQLLGFVQPCAASGEGGSMPTVMLRPVRPLDAPELHQNGGSPAVAADQLPPADVWAMCVLLLFMLLGEPPFASAEPGACPRYREFVQTGDLAAILGSALASVPEALRPLLAKALRNNADERPTAAALAAALARSTSSDSLPTPPAPPTVPSTDANMSEATVVISSDEGAVKEQSKKRGGEGWAEGYAAGWSAATSVLTTDAPTKGEGATLTCVQSAGGAPIPTGAAASFSTPSDSELMPPPRCNPLSTTSAVTQTAQADGGPPFRPTLKQGYVRSLGWQALPQPLDILVQAVSAALVALDTPFTLREKEYRFVIRPSQEADEMPPTPQSDSPQMGVSPSASPSPFGGHRSLLAEGLLPQDDRSGMIGETAPIQPLVIFIQLFRESRTSPRHDISVRRVQGTNWRFRLFYTAFRSQVSQQLGMADYSQLSLFSPMQPRRTLPPSSNEPLSYWSHGISRSRGKRGVGSSEAGREWPSPPKDGDAAMAAEEERAGMFKRTKAKITSSSFGRAP